MKIYDGDVLRSMSETKCWFDTNDVLSFIMYIYVGKALSELFGSLDFSKRVL